MPLTSDTVEELNGLVDIFFEKVGRKERMRKQILKLMDECEAYLYPKIRDWMQGARKQIIRDIKNRILKRDEYIPLIKSRLIFGPIDHSTGKSIVSFMPVEKKSKSQIIIDYVDWEMIEEEGKSIIKPAYLNIMEKSGNLSRAHARIEASFDVINPLSVGWAEKYSSELVTLIEKETKKGIREIVSYGLKEGKTLTQIAKDIEHLKDVGLNGRQSAALLKYRKALEAQKLPKELYLQKYTKRYDRLLRDRSKLIARTEVSRSVNEGYLDSLEGTRYEEVEISSAGDACTFCLDLAGIKFKRSEARGRLPVHPNCRCHWIVVIPRVKKPKVPKKPEKPEVEIPGFVPARTMAEAGRYAERDLIKSGGHISSANFGNMSLDNANMVNNRLTDLINDYKIKPNFIGSSQSIRRAVKRVYPRVEFKPVSGRTFAETISLPNNEIAIAFNEKYFEKGGEALLKRELENCFASGFHKLKNIEHIVDHEYAHVLDMVKKLSVKSDFVKHYAFLKDRSLVKMAISGYAEADGLTESWAEIFALYRANKLPPLRKTLVEGLLK
ncbi:hypothetical protein ES703_34033 [subsurface metagenome]